MKLFTSALGFIVFLLALAFALSNRQSALISLWPLDATVEAPLYLLTLGSLMLGFLFGAVFMWFGMLPHRFAARRLNKELSTLRGKLDGIHQTIMPAALSDSRRGGAAFLTPRPKTGRVFWKPRL